MKEYIFQLPKYSLHYEDVNFNLNKLIFVNKNWSFDPHVGCLKLSNIAVVCDAKSNLIDELEAKFMDEVEGKESPNANL